METEKLDLLKSIFVQIYGQDIDYKMELGEDSDEVVLSVSEEHMPFLIGRNGRNIKAFRELFFVHNKLHNTNYTLRVIE